MEYRIPQFQRGYLTSDFPSHRHPYGELHVFTSGTGHFAQQDCLWRVKRAVMTLTPPGTAHALQVDQPLAFFYVDFEAEPVLHEALEVLARRQEKLGPLELTEAQLATAAELKDKLDSSQRLLVSSGVHGFRSWLFELARDPGDSGRDGVTLALAYIQDNLGNTLCLDDLANVAGQNRFSLLRGFKARTGLTPMRYVMRSRVEAAAFLLASKRLTLDEIAVQLKFADGFHLGKAFRRWKGVSPGRWRQGRKRK